MTVEYPTVGVWDGIIVGDGVLVVLVILVSRGWVDFITVNEGDGVLGVNVLVIVLVCIIVVVCVGVFDFVGGAVSSFVALGLGVETFGGIMEVG